MEERKPIYWIGSSKKDFMSMPPEVQDDLGFALYQAELGKKHASAKPWKGLGGASVLEIVEDHDGNTYRAVYTVRFENAVYVLHAFQKKSKTGIATAKADVDLIKRWLKLAKEDFERWKESQQKSK